MTPASPIPEFLDLDLLSRLGSLEMQARFLVDGFMSGLHRSPRRGFNVEFKEYRSYTPGDEPRTIDWRAFGRTDRLQVRVREEDTNLLAHVVIDASASMDYRSPRATMTKWAYARSLAAAMIVLLQRQRDAVGLAVVGDERPAFVRPSVKASETRRMMALLDRQADGRREHLAESLAAVAQLARARSIVMVISDFYEDPQALEGTVGRLRFSGCEPIFMHVLDPRELELDYETPVRLREAETGRELHMSADLLRKDYLAAFDRHRKAVADVVRTYGGEYQLLRTDEPPYRALGSYLAKRSGAL